MILGIRSVAPALALGNAVVFKPDPRTAVSGGVSFARIFEEAGLPPGVLQVLPGGADAGEALVADPHVRVISFTGSTAAGRKVGELGAPPPQARAPRARRQLRAHRSRRRRRRTSGVGWSVRLVPPPGPDLHDDRPAPRAREDRRPVHRAAERARPPHCRSATRPATRSRSGRSSTPPSATRFTSSSTSSVDAGATLAAGGTYDGLFYRPTVLTNVHKDTPAYANEVFGPVAPVMRFSTVEEAAELAAATDYGLSLGILTRDPLKGLALADLIPTGIVHINDQTVSDEAQIPFGGVGDSGTGSRFGGSHRQHRRVHRDAVGHDAQRDSAVSVLEAEPCAPKSPSSEQGRPV